MYKRQKLGAEVVQESVKSAAGRGRYHRQAVDPAAEQVMAATDVQVRAGLAGR